MGLSKHGYWGTPEYKCWKDMKYRCLNPNAKNFIHYGGRGIKICERWLTDFSNFLQDMGARPSSEYSLERIDNNGNYEPSNCHWATWQEQMLNRRKWKISRNKMGRFANKA